MTPRLVAITGLAIVAAVGAVAVGGVPLLAGLGLVAALALAALPGGSRRYLLRRVVQVVGSVFFAMAIVWLLVHNYPDASRLDDTGVVAAMERYIAWIGDVVAGEMGDTQYSETVEAGVSRTIPISLQLLAYSQVMAVVIAIPGAMLGARFRGRAADVGFRGVGLLGLAAPTFVSGPILVYLLGVGELNVFGAEIGVGIFPTGRYVPLGRGVVDHLASVALPSFTLALTTAATYLVLLRSEMLQQLQSEHVQLARSKGLTPFRIVRSHALRPAAPTMVAAIGAQSALVLGHLVVVERIFLIPGFGDYVLVAIGRRDVAAVAGALFVTSVIVGVVNLFADALLLVVDPRIGR
ncbi:MAG: ABC transporter permease [Acidimicrobiales bacterium]